MKSCRVWRFLTNFKFQNFKKYLRDSFHEKDDRLLIIDKNNLGKAGRALGKVFVLQKNDLYFNFFTYLLLKHIFFPFHRREENLSYDNNQTHFRHETTRLDCLVETNKKKKKKKVSRFLQNFLSTNLSHRTEN